MPLSDRAGGDRLLLYVVGYAPPIGIFTRLPTGRLLIPSYDQIFLAPLCAALISLITPTIGDKTSIPLVAACPAALSLVMLIILTARPSLNVWRLTGGHQLKFSVSSQNKVNFIRVG